MISARTARIDDNLGRGTDGSNPVPSNYPGPAASDLGRVSVASSSSIVPRNHAVMRSDTLIYACIRYR